MNTKMLHTPLWFLVFSAYSSSLSAHCLDLYHPDHSSGGSMSISSLYYRADLESTDQYLSGPAGTEDWEAVNSVDGDLYGISIKARPPILGKRITLDYSYLSGDLKGTFNTQEVTSTPEGPYSGTVKFDRDEWKLGANIFILNAVYARLEYSTFEMDGDWVYSAGYPDEPQKYEFDAYTIGAGFTQNYLSEDPHTVFEEGFGLVGNVFFGLSFFDYKHTEELTGASVKTDGTGYTMNLEFLGTYNMNLTGGSQLSTYAGFGFNYNENNAAHLDLSDKGLTAKLGIHINF
jgi:hypothetical protein